MRTQNVETNPGYVRQKAMLQFAAHRPHFARELVCAQAYTTCVVSAERTCARITGTYALVHLSRSYPLTCGQAYR